MYQSCDFSVAPLPPLLRTDVSNASLSTPIGMKAQKKERLSDNAKDFGLGVYANPNENLGAEYGVQDNEGAILEILGLEYMQILMRILVWKFVYNGCANGIGHPTIS